MTVQNILFMVETEGSHKCGECLLFNKSKCSFPDVTKNDKSCADFMDVKKNGKNKEVTITIKPEDLFEMVNIEPALINPAGGFTSNFAYEGFWAIDKTGRKAWGVIAEKDGNREIAVVGQNNKWASKVQLFGCYYRVVSPPLLNYESTWTLENLLRYKEHGAENLNPQAIYNDVADVIKYFVDLDCDTDSTEGKYATAACWTIGTYFYEVFLKYPYMLAVGVRASGKTQLVSACVFQSYHATEPKVNSSISAMFREIETCKPTMFIDNAEQYYESQNMSEENRSMIQMLDIGFHRGGKVPRVEGDSNSRHIEEYCVYGPKGITTIMGVTGSLESRSIGFSMVETDKKIYSDRSNELKLNPDKPTDAKATQIKRNRNMLYAARMNLWRTVQRQYDELDSSSFGVINRDWDCWRPIFTIAKIFCPDKIPEILKFAKELSALNKDSLMDSEKEDALAALASLWTGKEEWIEIQTFATALQNIKQQTNSKAIITGNHAGAILRSLGFIERKKGAKGKRLFLINAVLYNKHAASVGFDVKDAPAAHVGGAAPQGGFSTFPASG